MIILILIGIMIVIALIGMDAAHNRYRQRWLKAVELLAASDEARDQAQQKANVFGHHASVLRSQIERNAGTMRDYREYDERRQAEIEELKRGYAELYQLGVELVAEREGAAAAHQRAVSAPKPPRPAFSAQQLDAEQRRRQMAHESILKLIEEGGKGAAHTP